MDLRFRYDSEVDAAYLRFSTTKVVQSAEVSPGVVLDFDAEGRIVALEVMQASMRLSNDALLK